MISKLGRWDQTTTLKHLSMAKYYSSTFSNVFVSIFLFFCARFTLLSLHSGRKNKKWHGNKGDFYWTYHKYDLHEFIP